MKKPFLMALLLLLIPAMTFAQSGMISGSFDNMSGKNRGMEISLGSQLTNFRETGTALHFGPAIALLWRQYFEPINDTMEFGYSIATDLTFVPEREWKVPGGFPDFTFNNKTYNKGDILPITWAESDYIMSLSMVIGPSIKGKIYGDFTFVADIGIGLNIDMASWKSLSSTTDDILYLNLTAINIGISLNSGFQYSLAAGSTKVIFELGVNFGYYFSRFNWIDLYWADNTVIGSSSGDLEAVNLFRFGTPYFVVGCAF